MPEYTRAAKWLSSDASKRSHKESSTSRLVDKSNKCTEQERSKNKVQIASGHLDTSSATICEGKNLQMHQYLHVSGI